MDQEYFNQQNISIQRGVNAASTTNYRVAAMDEELHESQQCDINSNELTRRSLVSSKSLGFVSRINPSEDI